MKEFDQEESSLMDQITLGLKKSTSYIKDTNSLSPKRYSSTTSNYDKKFSDTS